MNNWYLLAAIPVFGLLILVHEFGHFITAKWAGIRVEEFGLGFPPRVVGIRKRDTGGWEVIWFGSGREEEDMEGTWRPQEDHNSLATPRAHPAPHHHPRHYISSDTGPTNHTIYSLNLLPIGGFVRMPGENGDVNDEEGRYDPQSFAAKSAGKRIIVLCAGVTMNFLLAMVLFSVAYGLGEPTYPAQISAVEPDSPAAMAGLQANDTIISVNNEPVHLFTDVRNIVNGVIADDHNQHNTVPVTLVIRHAGERRLITTTVNVREHPPAGQGAMGIEGKTVLVSSPVWQAPFKGVAYTITTTGEFVQALGQMVTGSAPFQLTGPVGIVRITGVVAQSVPTDGWWPLLSLTALLSLNLAIINILPIPALDGGRVLFILIELVRGGKRLKPEREGMINFIGMAILLTLMVVITFFDISNIIH
jgi:regulator of sigma E protease